MYTVCSNELSKCIFNFEVHIMQFGFKHKDADMKAKLIDDRLPNALNNRYIHFPIHLHEHWTVVVFDTEAGEWHHYNSMKPRSGIVDPHYSIAKSLVNNNNMQLIRVQFNVMMGNFFTQHFLLLILIHNLWLNSQQQYVTNWQKHHIMENEKENPNFVPTTQDIATTIESVSECPQQMPNRYYDTSTYCTTWTYELPLINVICLIL